MNSKISVTDKRIDYVLNKVFFSYLILSPIIVVLMTLVGFNKVSFYFYIFSTLISGVYLTFELYKDRKVNHRVILYFILLVMSIYQIIFYIYKVPYFENYIFVQFILICLTILIFLNSSNLLKFKDFIVRNIRWILAIYSMATIFYLILFFTKLGFANVWGGQYFQGYFEFPHQASYEFFMLQGIGLMLYLLSEEKIYKYLSLFILVVSILINSFTGARTSFILSLVVFIPIMYRYFRKNIKVLFILIGIMVVFLILNLFFNFIDIENIPMVQKFVHSLSGKNNLFTSREFWDDLMGYWQQNYTMTEFLTGRGFGVSIYINGLLGFPGLWSHNDFIELLLCVGVIGFVYYSWLIINIVYKYKDYILLILIVGLGFLNGFFAYAYVFASIPVYLLITQILRNYKQLKN